MAGSGGTLLSRSLSSYSSCSSLLPRSFFLFSLSKPSKRGFHKTLCLSTTTSTPTSNETLKQSLLLDRLRSRHLKDSPKPPKIKIKTNPNPLNLVSSNVIDAEVKNKKKLEPNEGFEELNLSEEVLGAVKELGIENPTEIQCIGIPAVLEGKSVVLGSHTGSGKTLAYMLPLVQLLRRDEELFGMLMKPRRPRAVVLCPTRELSEQVFRVAKSISHHARFRSTRISGGVRSRPQEDSLNVPVDMVVGTPGRVLQHIEDGNMVYGDIKYLVLDEADTMFDRGFGPDIRKFLAPLKKRQEKPGDQGFQTVLVTATMTQAVQKLVDDEFQGILHLRTSTLHKKIASARHDFIELSSSENKLESLLQVLEPSLAKGNRVMVFCNTLNSSRAVDHFLRENQLHTVNYHGEVPAMERVENLKKFKSEEGDCPTLVCTDLAARGLDLAVDHVIMFDFPSNSIDYLHRTGRTARMGAKGKVTSLVTKKDLLLATRIEEAIKKNESLESLSSNVNRDSVKLREKDKKGKASDIVKMKNKNTRNKSAAISKSPKVIKRYSQTSSQKAAANKTVKRSSRDKAGKKVVTLSKPKPVKYYGSSMKRDSSKGKKSDAVKATTSKLRVVGFRGRSSLGKKNSPRST